MALLETLVVNLGAGVLKGLGKLWLKDNPVLDAAAGSMIDTLKKKIDDYGTARSVDKLLRDIKDDICDKLAAFISREFTDLGANERDAAILAVGDLLAEDDLLSEVVRADLEATLVERAYRERAGARFRELGSSGEAFARVLLREAVNFVVEAVRELPSFDAAANVELLRRTTETLTRVRSVLDRVEAIGRSVEQSRGAPEKAAASFEIQYRRSLAGLLDELELFGLRLVGGGISKYRLTMAYVTLKATTSSTPEPGIIDEAFAGRPHAVVRGEAGSGKTTLMQWLAVRAALGQLPGKLEPWNGLVPFYLRMRDYADAELPAPENFLRPLMANLVGEMPQGWVNQRLRHGAMILVDGVDELPQAKRRAFAQWLLGLVREYPTSVIIVSSRPAALDADSQPRLGKTLHDAGFTRVDIESMSPADSQALIEQWHAAVANDLVGRIDPEWLAGLQVRLVNQIREKAALRALASSPLLCAMICALNFDRGNATLPDDRMQLYRLALAMLLGDRDRDRQIPALLEHDEREELLDQLAYWFLRNRKSEATKTDVEGQIQVASRRLQRLRDMTPASILQDLLERSGVLRQPQHDVIGFIHRTFLEFMGARAAIAANDLDHLVEKAKEEDWRETIVFAAGHASQAKRDEFISLLLKRKIWRSRPLSLEVTAACCIETVGRNIAPHLLAQLKEQARRLFPPTNLARAAQLAAAAAMEPGLLMGHAGRGPIVAAACIRTAAIVAGPRMLEVIASYAFMDSEMVEAELLRAWDAFEDEEYIEKVLRLRSRLSGIDLATVSDEEFYAFRLLTAFGQSSSYASHVASLQKGLDRYRRHKRLELGSLTAAFTETIDAGNPVNEPASTVTSSSFSVSNYLSRSLRKLTSLKGFSLKTVDPQVLDAVASLPKLTSLAVEVEQPIALDSLTRIPQLESLKLEGAGIVDVSGLSTMQNLRDLSLGYTNVEDLGALARMRLSSLEISYPGRQPSLVGPPLFVTYCKLTGLTFKTTALHEWLPDIEYLAITYPRQSETATFLFDEMSRLNRVWFQGTPVGMLSTLARCKHVRKIILSDIVGGSWNRIRIPESCENLMLFGEKNDTADLIELLSACELIDTLTISGFKTISGLPEIMQRNPTLNHVHVSASNIAELEAANRIAAARSISFDARVPNVSAL